MRQWTRGAILLVGSVCTAAAFSGSAAATFPGKDGRIANQVLNLKTGRTRLVTMEPDGSHVRVVARFRQPLGGTAWSPDGRWLAFDRQRGQAAGIWRVRSDGSGLQRVVRPTAGIFNVTPSWSPDGRWIVYAHEVLGHPPMQLWVVHPNGTDSHRLVAHAGTESCSPCTDPRYSPDGRLIAFTELLPHDRSAVAIVHADGTHLRLLAATRRVGALGDDWSPDGRWIAFGSRGRTLQSMIVPGSLYLIHPDGRGLHRLTRPGRKRYSDLGPAFSPRGDQITFQRTTCVPGSGPDCFPAPVGTWVMDADGRHAHPIMSLSADHLLGSPVWGPATS